MGRQEEAVRKELWWRKKQTGKRLGIQFERENALKNKFLFWWEGSVLDRANGKMRKKKRKDVKWERGGDEKRKGKIYALSLGEGSKKRLMKSGGLLCEAQNLKKAIGKKKSTGKSGTKEWDKGNRV